MNWKKLIAEAATLIVAAILCALTANALAPRERKVALVPASAPPPSRVPLPAPPGEGGRRRDEGTTTIAQTITPATPPKTSTTGNRQPITPPKPPAVKKEFKPHPDKPYIEIHFDDVEALHKSGALFLDARRTSVYEQGHIRGARPFSVWEADLDEKVNKLFAERSDPRDQEKPIVIYCSGGDCEDSHMLAQKLWGIQFNNVYVYKDGFPDWEKRGGESRTGATP